MVCSSTRYRSWPGSRGATDPVRDRARFPKQTRAFPKADADGAGALRALADFADRLRLSRAAIAPGDQRTSWFFGNLRGHSGTVRAEWAALPRRCEDAKELPNRGDQQNNTTNNQHHQRSPTYQQFRSERIRPRAQPRATSVTSVSSVVKNDPLDSWTGPCGAGRCFFSPQRTRRSRRR